MIVNQQPTAFRVYSKAIEALMAHPRLQGPTGMRFQHIGVLTILLEMTDEDHPVSVKQLSDMYDESRSITQTILKNLSDVGYAKRLQTTASHGRGRSFVYYSSLRLILEAVERLATNNS